MQQQTEARKREPEQSSEQNPLNNLVSGTGKLSKANQNFLLGNNVDHEQTIQKFLLKTEKQEEKKLKLLSELETNNLHVKQHVG